MRKNLTRAQRIKTKSSQRRESKKAELKQEILRAATELFLEHGYEKFSLRQVAEEIGYSPTTIYLHFKNKEELLFMTALEGFKEFGRALKIGYESTADPLERIFAIGKAYVDFGLEHPVHYRLMFMQENDIIYKKLPDCEGSIIDSFGILQKTIEEAIAAEVIECKDAQLFSALMWSRVHGIVSLAINVPKVDKNMAYEMLEINRQMMKKALES